VLAFENMFSGLKKIEAFLGNLIGRVRAGAGEFSHLCTMPEYLKPEEKYSLWLKLSCALPFFFCWMLARRLRT
jgi:hypothetical protein